MANEPDNGFMINLLQRIQADLADIKATLPTLATKEELKALATKEDIAGIRRDMASKEDLLMLRNEMREGFASTRSEISTLEERVIALEHNN